MSARRDRLAREFVDTALELHRRRLWHEVPGEAFFAVRVPTETVQSFVRAVVQSEIKGTPLVETLRIQAETLRSRRSLAGEEAASRAAVLMMVPLMLILCAIILVLMGPFLLAGMGSGF